MSKNLEERIVKNNRIFREANEGIRAKSHEYDNPLDRIPFLCECPDPECTTVVRLTLGDYEGVRANPARFLTAPGHEAAEAPAARVVSRELDYVVVEKVA